MFDRLLRWLTHLQEWAQNSWLRGQRGAFDIATLSAFALLRTALIVLGSGLVPVSTYMGWGLVLMFVMYFVLVNPAAQVEESSPGYRRARRRGNLFFIGVALWCLTVHVFGPPLVDWSRGARH